MYSKVWDLNMLSCEVLLAIFNSCVTTENVSKLLAK